MVRPRVQLFLNDNVSEIGKLDLGTSFIATLQIWNKNHLKQFLYQYGIFIMLRPYIRLETFEVNFLEIQYSREEKRIKSVKDLPS